MAHATASGGPARASSPPTMGRVLNDPGEDEWTVRLLTNGRSQKAADIRRRGDVVIVVQHEPDLAYVALTAAGLRFTMTPSEARKRWKRAYDVYFPAETDRANAIFVEVEIERMELWIQGVTPEPFGLRATVLKRDATGRWRLARS